MEKNLVLEEIVEIRKIGVQQTYDFTVPDTHCFFANGILVHNSGGLEEGADIVLGLYWNQKHEASYVSKPNVFEILVLKQRDGGTGMATVSFSPQHYRFEDALITDNAPYVEGMENE